jgi:hypothetical protein
MHGLEEGTRFAEPKKSELEYYAGIFGVSKEGLEKKGFHMSELKLYSNLKRLYGRGVTKPMKTQSL